MHICRQGLVTCTRIWYFLGTSGARTLVSLEAHSANGGVHVVHMYVNSRDGRLRMWSRRNRHSLQWALKPSGKSQRLSRLVYPPPHKCLCSVPVQFHLESCTLPTQRPWQQALRKCCLDDGHQIRSNSEETENLVRV